jgi:serine/threonine protein phosphatase 1
MWDGEENMRLYVIGDVHGQLDLLEGVIAAIQRDVGSHGDQALTVTLGDYIDRGPHSRDVIEHLAGNPFPTSYVALKGNHETLLMSFLVDPAIGHLWGKLGGLETIASFGVPLPQSMLGRNFEDVADRLKAVITPKHFGFLNSLRPSLTVGRYFLCHAGVRPGVSLERQSEDDLLWIRDEFLESTADFGKIVVHGHTPVREPVILKNRINIDTGAFATGRLTCIVLEEGRHRFLT